jgi:hypothetical protein
MDNASKTPFCRLLIGGTLLFLASGALFAGETLTITNGVTTVNGTFAMCGAGAVAGDLCFGGTIGTWQISSIQGDADISAPATAPFMDLSVLAKTIATKPPTVTNLPLTITFTETGFGPANAGMFDYMETGNLTKVNMSDTFSFADNGNVVAGGTNTIKSVKGANGVVTVPIGGYGDSVPLTPFPTGQYSLTLTEKIFPTAVGGIASGAVVSSDFSLTGTTTPEPGFYALTGAGLAGLLAVAMRRRKKQETEQTAE